MPLLTQERPDTIVVRERRQDGLNRRFRAPEVEQLGHEIGSPVAALRNELMGPCRNRSSLSGSVIAKYHANGLSGFMVVDLLPSSAERDSQEIVVGEFP